MSDVSHERESAPERIEVEMFEWSEGFEGQILETKELGPCIGVAVYDPETKVGQLAHIPEPVSARSIYDEIAKSVQEHTADKTRLLAWLRGGLLPTMSRRERDYGLESRAYAVDKLTELGIPVDNVDIAWSEAYYETVDMSLNCTTGEVVVAAVDTRVA